MAFTYTTNMNWAKPAAGDTGWDDEMNSNFDSIDGLFGATGTHDHSGAVGHGAVVALSNCSGVLTNSQLPTTATIATVVATSINSLGNRITFCTDIDLYTKNKMATFYDIKVVSLYPYSVGGNIYNYGNFIAPGFTGSFATLTTHAFSAGVGDDIHLYSNIDGITQAHVGSFAGIVTPAIHGSGGGSIQIYDNIYDPFTATFATTYILQSVFGTVRSSIGSFGTIHNLPLGTLVKPIYVNYGMATMGTTGMSVTVDTPLFTIPPNSSLGMANFRFYHDLSYSTYVLNLRSYSDFESEPAHFCSLELDGTAQLVSLGAAVYSNYELRYPWAKGTAGFYECMIRGTSDPNGTLYIQGLQLSAYRYA